MGQNAQEAYRGRNLEKTRTAARERGRRKRAGGGRKMKGEGRLRVLEAFAGVLEALSVLRDSGLRLYVLESVLRAERLAQKRAKYGPGWMSKLEEQ